MDIDKEKMCICFKMQCNIENVIMITIKYLEMN